jgi:hypothetical protein
VDLVGGELKLAAQVRSIVPVHLALLFLCALDGYLGCPERGQPLHHLSDLALTSLREYVKSVSRLVPIEAAILKVKYAQKHNACGGPILRQVLCERHYVTVLKRARAFQRIVVTCWARM